MNWSRMQELSPILAAFALGALLFAQDPQGSPGSSPAQHTQPQRVRISEKVANSLAIKKMPPTYSKEARKAHVQGDVVMRAVISASGDVEQLDVISGDPFLDTSALDAVRQWKYKPYKLNGQAVEVETQITIHFRLSS